jgi:peroxiredoxin
MALVTTPEPEIGSPCPDFSLLATDGKTYSRADLANSQASLVMFICNHCPYVKAIEDRLISLGTEMKERGVPILAISSNDASIKADDSFESMRTRALDKQYPFAYLYDESQDIARAFGAVCTPDFFVYDRDLKLAYRGRLDDAWKDAGQVSTQDLKAALEALVAGVRPSERQIPSMGCSIKWKVL